MTLTNTQRKAMFAAIKASEQGKRSFSEDMAFEKESKRRQGIQSKIDELPLMSNQDIMKIKSPSMRKALFARKHDLPMSDVLISERGFNQ